MKKKRGLKIKINFSNRLAYTLIAIVILAAVGIGVYALSPGVAPNPGHSISEVAPPSGCSNGQYLLWNATLGNWACVTLPLAKGTKLYTVANYCTSVGSVTTSSTCQTTGCACGYASCSYHYTCDGSCVNNPPSSTTCNNNLLGYLVN